jgi:anhydro-N-acetylmuramic acid kinase
VTTPPRAFTDPVRTPAERAALSREAVLVGVMSGTSLDGVTVAVVRFATDDAGTLTHALLGLAQRPFTSGERERLAAAMTAATAREYVAVRALLSERYAQGVVEALASSGVARGDVAAIAAHGQTLWHEPGVGTWQALDPALLAERTQLPVVSDFRSRDVAAGGQGAPLVPLADALLYAAPDRWRALQNLGGIGNVTVVPPAGADPSLTAVRAFDTGPGMVLIDACARAADPALPYDVDGRLARAGRVAEGVVAAHLADPWFAASPPKSTGRERYDAAYLARFRADVAAAFAGATPADAVATAVALTARSVADQFARFIPEPVDEVLLSGGGARHPGLAAQLAAALAPRRVRRFAEAFYDGDAKEAVAFALLGRQHLLGLPANVPTATGARGPRVLGSFTPA